MTVLRRGKSLSESCATFGEVGYHADVHLDDDSSDRLQASGLEQTFEDLDLCPLDVELEQIDGLIEPAEEHVQVDDVDLVVTLRDHAGKRHAR